MGVKTGESCTGDERERNGNGRPVEWPIHGKFFKRTVRTAIVVTAALHVLWPCRV